MNEKIIMKIIGWVAVISVILWYLVPWINERPEREKLRQAQEKYAQEQTALADAAWEKEKFREFELTAHTKITIQNNWRNYRFDHREQPIKAAGFVGRINKTGWTEFAPSTKKIYWKNGRTLEKIVLWNDSAAPIIVQFELLDRYPRRED